MGARRDLDIVLYGATGVVGRLTAQYLAAAGPDLRIGLAGRSSERMNAVRDELGETAERWPVFVDDPHEPGHLASIAARTRVMVSTVGPYAQHGLPIVDACATTGTDYVDLAGEVPFVRRSIDRYHRIACDSGARIVHSCGFDSIPSDLSVYALHRRVVADGSGELARTTYVLRVANYATGFSRGTVDTMVELMRSGSSDAGTRRLLDDPYGLSPNRAAEPEVGPQPDLTVHRGEELAPELAGLWTSGYLMALYNTRCVRRTNALLNWAYGRGFTYSETASMGSSLAAPAMALMTNAAISGATLLGGQYVRMFPTGVLETLTARPITTDAAAGGHYRIETYTTTTRGTRYVARVAQQGDPGYAATSVLLGESALALVLDRDSLPERHGVLTPVAAMGDVLLGRLPAAGVAIDVARLG